MKRLIAPFVMLLAITFAFVWFALPEPVSRFLLNLNNTSAGLSSKTLTTTIGDIQYLEGGQGETIVLLHGIYARKEHWVDLARELTKRFRVIAIDLPGFGDNQIRQPQQYRLKTQANNLDVVLQSLNIESAHIGANSMGAQVVSLLAIARPEVIKSLAFIGSPLGVTSPIKSEMENALINGNIPLLVKTEADFEQRNNWLFPKTPAIPSPIMKTWMHQELTNSVRNEEIWHAVNDFSDTRTLLEIAPFLSMPTLIIWCQQDRIFHVSGAKTLARVLPNSKLTILENCGHVPMLDKPKEVSEVYLSFLKRNLGN
ncbi:alpha/beta fold hydrolase [Glaciecola petra]|uniref:Alpha/beta hydrolase n=1 Tax=Glaciecola petra TaxID=3075602 RepID=A0ABU2ZTT2_9ALTE|nr:alpha/beta hydrolase [Aestuariibacter sp. P117]MDT0596055.1 alpha/beta hydrolase [Aestuariibacter sp. P117]